MTEIEALFHEAKSLNYPNTMASVQNRIRGKAFFPGGRGTFDNSLTISDKPVMILGQDFDTEDNFKKAQAAGQEDIERNSTWRNLLVLLKQVGIDPTSCFFTNAIMGLRVERQGSLKNTGKSPAFDHPEFIQQCQNFFLTQLKAQQPKLVLVLGIMPAKFLSGMGEKLQPWKQFHTITAIDAAGHQVFENVIFSNGVITSLCLLTHPSYRPVNIKKRRYNKLEGAPAEEQMLLDMMRGRLPAAG